MKRLTDIDFKRTYGDVPDSFHRRVRFALHRTGEEKPVKHVTLRTILIAALLVVIVSVALAAVLSPTASIFGWFYGPKKQEELLQGNIAPSGESIQVGDVIYCIDDVIYKNGTVYGSGIMKAAAGAKIVLLPEDYGPNDPAGYDLLYGYLSGIETPPDNAPTYGEKATDTGAKLLMTRCLPDGVVKADGSLETSTIGYALFPKQDGTVTFLFEFAVGSAADGQIQQARSYTLQMYCANWEVSPEGEHLMDTREQMEWIVTITPTQTNAQ